MDEWPVASSIFTFPLFKKLLLSWEYAAGCILLLLLSWCKWLTMVEVLVATAADKETLGAAAAVVVVVVVVGPLKTEWPV